MTVRGSPRVRHTSSAGHLYRAIALFVFLILHLIFSFAGPLVEELPVAIQEAALVDEVISEIDAATSYSCYQPFSDTGVNETSKILSTPVLIVIWGLIFVSMILLFRQRRGIFVEVDRSGAIVWRSVGPRLIVALFVGWFLFWIVRSTCFLIHLLAYGI